MATDDRPAYGVQYALTSKPGQPSIMRGNTWAESRIVPTDGKPCRACGTSKKEEYCRQHSYGNAPDMPRD